MNQPLQTLPCHLCLLQMCGTSTDHTILQFTQYFFCFHHWMNSKLSDVLNLPPYHPLLSRIENPCSFNYLVIVQHFFFSITGPSTITQRSRLCSSLYYHRSVRCSCFFFCFFCAYFDLSFSPDFLHTCFLASLGANKPINHIFLSYMLILLFQNHKVAYD